MRVPFRLGLPVPVTSSWPRPRISKECLETYQDLKDAEKDLREAEGEFDRLDAQGAPPDDLREAGGHVNDLLNKRDRLKREWDEECVPYPLYFYVQPYEEMIEDLEEPSPPGGITIPAVEPPPVPPGPPGFFPPGPAPGPVLAPPPPPPEPPPPAGGTPTASSYTYRAPIATWGKKAGLFRAAMSLSAVPVWGLSGPGAPSAGGVSVDRFLAEEGLESIDVLSGKPDPAWALEECWRKFAVLDPGRFADLRRKLTEFLASGRSETSLPPPEYALLEEALECRESVTEEKGSEDRGHLHAVASVVGIAGGLASLVALLW